MKRETLNLSLISSTALLGQMDLCHLLTWPLCMHLLLALLWYMFIHRTFDDTFEQRVDTVSAIAWFVFLHIYVHSRD